MFAMAIKIVDMLKFIDLPLRHECTTLEIDLAVAIEAGHLPVLPITSVTFAKITSPESIF